MNGSALLQPIWAGLEFSKALMQRALRIIDTELELAGV